MVGLLKRCASRASGLWRSSNGGNRELRSLHLDHYDASYTHPAVCASSQLDSFAGNTRAASYFRSRILEHNPFSLRQLHYSTQARTVSEAAKVEAGGKRFDNRPGHERKSQSTLMYLAALVIGMVGVTYASVPLYRRFCQATGYGGTVQRKETVEEKIARHSKDDKVTARELVVQFNSDVSDNLPWKFTPCQTAVKIRPGESSLAFFTAENLSSEPITGVSTYNVAPMKAGIYFNKIQCFCFEEQRLLPGEKIDMPVFFYVDPEFATDPRMNDIKNLVLSYTFFRVDEAKQ